MHAENKYLATPIAKLFSFVVINIVKTIHFGHNSVICAHTSSQCHACPQIPPWESVTSMSIFWSYLGPRIQNKHCCCICLVWRTSCWSPSVSSVFDLCAETDKKHRKLISEEIFDIQFSRRNRTCILSDSGPGKEGILPDPLEIWNPLCARKNEVEPLCTYLLHRTRRAPQNWPMDGAAFLKRKKRKAFRFFFWKLGSYREDSCVIFSARAQRTYSLSKHLPVKYSLQIEFSAAK